jgi:ribosomal-protein-alanine N-acetyltransferase
VEYQLSIPQESHIPALRELELTCFGAHWAATDFKRELENPNSHYFILTAGSRVVAYLGYWQILEEAHIISVGVAPDCRKQRLAQRLLCYMLEQCITKGIQWITLEVKDSNVAAQELYAKFGFSIMGRRKNYYQADRQDALVMWTDNIATPEYAALLQRIQAETSPLVI